MRIVDFFHRPGKLFVEIPIAEASSGGKKATSSLVDPSSIITLNGKKVGHDYRCESIALEIF